MNSSIDNRKPFNSLGKQKYHRPELVLYGKVANLTSGDFSGTNDAGGPETAMDPSPPASNSSGGSGASSDSVFDNFDW
jgi:hypothetical protein